MSLEQKDVEIVESVVRKNNDDIVVAIERGLERIVEHLNTAESRIYSRLADMEDKIEDGKQSVFDLLDTMREDVRELSKAGID